MTPKFSVVLIARNEVKTLPRLVDSLKEFQARGGEIVLVDTGSTDGTAAAARELGCRVEEVGTRFLREISEKQAYSINRSLDHREAPVVSTGDKLFDYAAARNFAASLASNDMVAMPDCDEIYTALRIDEVNKAIESGAEQLEYNFVFAHDEHGAEIVKFMHSKFYDRRKLKWAGIIHEVLQGEAKREFLPEHIIKLEHWQNPETNRGGYLKGLALDVLEHPDNDRNAHYYGRELLYAGRPLSAIRELERHVAMNKWPEERSQSLVHIGEAQMGLGLAKAAMHTWMDALDVCPTRREPLMKIAEHYYKLGNADQVITYVSSALQIPRSNFYASFGPYYEQYPHELLYWAYWQRGEKALSMFHFKQAFKFQPHNPKYLHDYRFYYDLPKISIIAPTLRPEGLKKLQESIAKLNYPDSLIEFIPLRDEPRIGVAKRLAEGVIKSTGEWLCYAADDMEFEPDCLIEAYLAHIAGGDDHAPSLIAFNSGMLLPDKGNICEHFMIHRCYTEEVLHGEIFDTDFNHVGVDNLLWAKMKKAGEAHRAVWARIRHNHFSRGGEMDDVARMAWDPQKVAADRELLEKKLADL